MCAEERGTVTISSTECGGPRVAEPASSEGFGSTLSRKVAQALEGKIEREWRPEGLVVHRDHRRRVSLDGIVAATRKAEPT